MDFKKFLKGLAAAGIGGAVIGVATVASNPKTEYPDIAKVALAGGAVSAAAYYKQSCLDPKPPKNGKHGPKP